MRTFLVLICSFALACLTGAQTMTEKTGKKEQPKKRATHAGQVSQPAGKAYGGPTTTGNPVEAKSKATKEQIHGATAIEHNPPGKAKDNVSPAGGTTFNKSKTVNKNMTVNKNYKVQQFNISKNANPKYQAVQFNKNYHIAGANNWRGAKYQVFANYHPVWHDRWWWRSHHNHVVFIFGGWYFWDASYWYPAWGYDPSSVYYFDGPIYASSPEMDPGQVVANVQAALQQQGYYQGEIDGILGPETRDALADYQSAQGLEPTGAVDEPTLEALGMA